MRPEEVDFTCNRLIRLLDEEPEEINLFMRGEVVTDYKTLVLKDLEAMRQIRDRIKKLDADN